MNAQTEYHFAVIECILLVIGVLQVLVYFELVYANRVMQKAFESLKPKPVALLPCPVCGGEAGATYYYSDNWLWRIGLPRIAMKISRVHWICRCFTDQAIESHAETKDYPTPEEACEAWNIMSKGATATVTEPEYDEYG